MKKSFKTVLIGILFFVLGTSNVFSQNKNNSKASKVQMIQFHSQHRCMTCNKIEALTKEVLKTYPDITFLLINVDESKNEKIAKQFQAYGTSLFLYNTATGKKMDLTNFAFMNAKNEEKYSDKLKKEINQFLN